MPFYSLSCNHRGILSRWSNWFWTCLLVEFLHANDANQEDIVDKIIYIWLSVKLRQLSYVGHHHNATPQALLPVPSPRSTTSTITGTITMQHHKHHYRHHYCAMWDYFRPSGVYIERAVCWATAPIYRSLPIEAFKAITNVILHSDKLYDFSLPSSALLLLCCAYYQRFKVA